MATIKSAAQLQILNPQLFEVTAVIQPRPTEIIEQKTLGPNESWYVSGPSAEGTWIAFYRTSDNAFLASKLLPQGTTIAQILLDTEIGLIFKQNPEEKLNLANGLNEPVIVQYEIKGTIALSENHLAPSGQPGSNIVAEQQPQEGTFLWIHFMREDRSTLSTFVASDAVSEVTVLGQEKYVVGTPYA